MEPIDILANNLKPKVMKIDEAKLPNNIGGYLSMALIIIKSMIRLFCLFKSMLIKVRIYIAV